MSRRLRTVSYTDVLLGPLDTREEGNHDDKEHHRSHYSPIDSPQPSEDEATKKKQRILLGFTIIAVILGLVLGFILSVHPPGEGWMEVVGFPGDLYIRMLKCLIVPLVSLSLIGAMANLGTMKEGKVGFYAVCWYIVTTVIAGSSGIVWASIFQPWTSLQSDDPPLPDDSSTSSSSTFLEPRTPVESVKQLLLQVFTDNIVKSALDMNMLGIITFSCVLGLVLAAMEQEKSEQVLYLVDCLSVAVQKMVGLVIWISPLGVFSLVSFHMGSSGDFWEIFKGMGLLIGARLTGVVVHGLLVLPFLLFIFTRKNPYKVLASCSQIWVIAFGTSSSAATLPVTIKTVEEVLEVSPPIARFVCTTGATVNMDAGAIAYSLTAVTLAYSVGMTLNVVQIGSIVLTSTLISIGAAALPSAGLINYIAVMATVGIPLDKAIAILSPMLSVDWFEDRIMTIVNIEGDVFAATTIHHHTKDSL